MIYHTLQRVQCNKSLNSHKRKARQFTKKKWEIFFTLIKKLLKSNEAISARIGFVKRCSSS